MVATQEPAKDVATSKDLSKAWIGWIRLADMRMVGARMRKNRQGGIIPETEAERKRARAADLITLPERIAGTNCSNCRFVTAGGWCTHKEVLQFVSKRMCCGYWDAPGSIRV